MSAGECRELIGTGLEKRASLGDPAAQVLLADALNKAGRHAEAIDWLARGGARTPLAHRPSPKLAAINLASTFAPVFK